MSEIRPEVQLFEKELGITPGMHAEIDARLDKIRKEWQEGKLEIAGTMDDLFEHRDKFLTADETQQKERGQLPMPEIIPEAQPPEKEPGAAQNLKADPLRPMEKWEIDAILRQGEADIKSGKRDPARDGIPLEECIRRRQAYWDEVPAEKKNECT